jgi:hypothetical protein
VRESEREVLAVEKALDAVDGVGALDVADFEGKRVGLHSVVKAGANELTFRIGVVGAKSVGEHILLHALLHVVDPFRLAIGSVVGGRTAKAVDIIRVLSAVLDETKAISLFTELHVLVLLEVTVLQTEASVGSLKNAHGGEDVAGSTMSLVLNRGTYIIRNEERTRKRAGTSHTLSLLFREMRASGENQRTENHKVAKSQDHDDKGGNDHRANARLISATS